MTAAGHEPPPVRWGLGDALAGWLVAQVGGFMASGLVLAASGREADEFDELSLSWIALAQLGLWFGLLGAPLLASWRKGNGPVRDFGLRGAWSDPFLGIGAGLATQVILIPILYLPIFWLFDVDTDDLSEVARGLTDRATDGVGVTLLVLIVGIGAPIVEEIFYRGLLQGALVRRLGPWPGVVISGVVFGAAHFQALQFPALATFGIVLGYLTLRTGRLAPAIAAHMAFNLLTVVTLV